LTMKFKRSIYDTQTGLGAGACSDLDLKFFFIINFQTLRQPSRSN